MTLPKFPQPTEIFNPSGERYRVWREEFVAWLQKERDRCARAYEPDAIAIIDKVLEAMGEQ